MRMASSLNEEYVMSNLAFDTLGTSKKLEAAGMERKQAEAVAIAIAEREGNLATKSNFDSLRSEVKSDINSLRTEVKSDINEVNSEMKVQFRWLMTMQVVVLLAIFALAYENS